MVCSYYSVIALLLAEGTGPEDCFRLPGTFEDVFKNLESAAGRGRLSVQLGKTIGDIPWAEFRRQIQQIEEHNVRVVTHYDSEFPAYLRDIAMPPPILFYQGDLCHLDRRGIAIVGSRGATARGVAFTRHLAADLADRDVVVISGMARGIDSAAHHGALDGGGATVAIVGTGLDIVYPRENKGLATRIEAQGCVVSELFMGVPPQRFTFPLRNRLISAVSRAVVVVEAAERSGALLTATWALEQGREVGAVPGFPGDPRSRGVNDLIKKGAFPVESADDILAAVPLIAREKGTVGTMRWSLSTREGSNATEQAVLEALGVSVSDPDQLARHVGKPVASIQRVLLDLEIRGIVGRDPSGLYYVL